MNSQIEEHIIDMLKLGPLSTNQIAERNNRSYKTTRQHCINLEADGKIRRYGLPRHYRWQLV